MYIVYSYAQKNRDSSHGVSAKVCIRILWKHKFATDMDIPCRLLIRMEEKRVIEGDIGGGTIDGIMGNYLKKIFGRNYDD